MPDVCIGCGLTVDDDGNLVSDVADAPDDSDISDVVFCDPGTGELRIPGDSNLWLGSEEVLLGAVPPAGTRKVHKTFTRVLSDSGGATYPINLGPSIFPNGIVSALVTPGYQVSGSDAASSFIILTSSTLTQIKLNAYNILGAILDAPDQIRVCVSIWGW